MKRIFDRHKMREYWQNMYHSAHRKIARGAELISRMLPWAKGESWRRKETKK